MCVQPRALKRSYGMMHFKPNLSKEMLLFTNLSSFVKSIGIAPYTVGFNFCFLTFYVPARPPPHA